MVWKENRENAYCEITPAILALKEQWEKKNYIDPKLYKEYNVKRGLRDEDGRGVLTGLTRVGEIQSYSVTEGEHIIPQDGILYYRGIDARELVKGSVGRRFAFEETAYLLLFGELPTAAQLEDFCAQLASYRTLPTNFFRDVIMKAPPRDLMNTMQRAILTLFCYDDKPNDIGLENVLRQSLQLMSNMPVLAIYAYQAWRFSQGESLFIHVPKPELSTAENFLRMIRMCRQGKIDMILAHGAQCTVVPGSRDHCADVCREKVEREGVYYANHVYNPFFYEGTKTYIYEVMEQLHRMPKHILIPVGNGTLFLGAVKALEHLLESGVIDRMPQIIAVQSENCDPILRAFANGEHAPAQVSPKPTLAEGIAIGVPMRGMEILDYARKYHVQFIHAPEDKILEARSALAKKGIYCEHTTAANYAAYLHYCRKYGAAEDCLITMCGAGLKSDH